MAVEVETCNLDHKRFEENCNFIYQPALGEFIKIRPEPVNQRAAHISCSWFNVLSRCHEYSINCGRGMRSSIH